MRTKSIEHKSAPLSGSIVKVLTCGKELKYETQVKIGMIREAPKKVVRKQKEDKKYKRKCIKAERK